jgi:hypothetical protein
VETKIRLKRDKSGGIHDYSGVLKRDVNELKSIFLSHTCTSESKQTEKCDPS